MNPEDARETAQLIRTLTDREGWLTESQRANLLTVANWLDDCTDKAEELTGEAQAVLRAGQSEPSEN